MLQLNLFVYDENHQLIPALSFEGAVPAQIQSLFSFLKEGMSFEVEVVKTDIKKS